MRRALYFKFQKFLPNFHSACTAPPRKIVRAKVHMDAWYEQVYVALEVERRYAICLETLITLSRVDLCH